MKSPVDEYVSLEVGRLVIGTAGQSGSIPDPVRHGLEFEMYKSRNLVRKLDEIKVEVGSFDNYAEQVRLKDGWYQRTAD